MAGLAPPGEEAGGRRQGGGTFIFRLSTTKSNHEGLRQQISPITVVDRSLQLRQDYFIMNSATKVGEIFEAAGTAFSKLGELTMQLHPPNDSSFGAKWTDEEIEMIHSCITKFGEELDVICERIKSRTVSQIRGALKKKAYEDMGLPPPISSSNSTPSTSPVKHVSSSTSPSPTRPKPPASSAMSPNKSSEVTLNMLNASGDDGDISGN